jgi:hypothetical protein
VGAGRKRKKRKKKRKMDRKKKRMVDIKKKRIVDVWKAFPRKPLYLLHSPQSPAQPPSYWIDLCEVGLLNLVIIFII